MSTEIAQHLIPPGVERMQQIDTIYWGGGTPSLLASAEIESLLHDLKSRFDISPDAEITLEANPDDISDIRNT